MKIQCLSRLADSFRASRSLDSTFEIPWEPCPAGMNGDLTVNCTPEKVKLTGSAVLVFEGTFAY